MEAQASDQEQKWPDLICSKKQKGDCRATFHSNLPLRSFAPLAFAVFPKLYQSRFLSRTTSEIRCKEQKGRTLCQSDPGLSATRKLRSA